MHNKINSLLLYQPNFRKILFGIFTISSILIYGCSKNDASAGGGGFSMPPTPVEVTQAKKQAVADKFEAVGTIEANEAITVVSEIDAAVVKLPFEEGTFINKGELIAQLDDSQLSAEVSRAEALFEQRQSTYSRVKKVYEQKAGTLQDLDDAAAALKVAKAELALAKARLAKTRIVAPFDGIIGSRRVSVGSFLRTGQAITEFANIDAIRVTFSAPERYLSELRRNAQVTVSTTAYSNHNVDGKIIVIEPVLDPETRNVRIVARVPNPGKKFLPGMSANVSAVLSERPDAVTIPSEAVFANGDQSFVFIVKPDSTVAQTPVKLGVQLSNIVEITDGLKPGTLVVQAGYQKLFEGAKVVPTSSEKNNAASL